MNHSNPVFAGLTEGLEPCRTRKTQAGDAITIDSELLAAEERIRIVRAVERQAELAEESLAIQRRAASAAERQAEAIETLVALFASTLGVGTASCADSQNYQTVNFIRTGLGRKGFACDADNIRAAQDD
ncbi:hypothetical protein [Bradyrhizobium sp. CCBAU 11434]|uniref:hypothetical protein n=1 Tax=Bradyrhizobium sp. CCBAU 11434 TaxID=1630885 RepID=UPI002306885F|nr:hypothetical protein [Bradyrhizobium sp. CCBAU 11434]